MSIISLIGSFEEVVLDLFFPRACIGCKEEGAWLCPSCSKRLPSCTPKTLSLGSLQATYLLPFADPLVREGLHLLKYGSIEEMARVLSSSQVGFSTLHFDFLENGQNPIWIPVPIGKKRRKSRGFNQAERIATVFANHFGGRVLDTVLKRNERKSLVGRGREERMRAVAGAFHFDDTKKSGLLPESSPVVLVDDVLTTGSTLSECAKIVLTATGRTPYVLALAHGE